MQIHGIMASTSINKTLSNYSRHMRLRRCLLLVKMAFKYFERVRENTALGTQMRIPLQ